MPLLLEKLVSDRERLVDIATQFMAAKAKGPLQLQVGLGMSRPSELRC